jgi:hypothetical protein
MPAAWAGEVRNVLCTRTKLYPERIERDHERVIFELLAERVREAGKAPHRHPHRQVRPLRIGRADVLRVGVACYLLSARSEAV